MQNKILIIEDDPYSATIYQKHISKSGYLTKIAFDGRHALEIIDNFQPNLIILDLILPKIDGFTLMHFFKNIPVIIISNLDQQSDIDKCINLGAKLFITKESLNYEALIKQIKNLLTTNVK